VQQLSQCYHYLVGNNTTIECKQVCKIHSGTLGLTFKLKLKYANSIVFVCFDKCYLQLLVAHF